MKRSERIEGSGFWDDLATLLADPQYFAAVYELERYELLRAWAALEENSTHRVVDRYAAAIEDPELGVEYGPGLAALLKCRHQHEDEAAAILGESTARARAGADEQLLAQRLGDLVRHSTSDSRPEANDERLALCRQLGDVNGEAEALCFKAWVRWFEGLRTDDDGGEAEARSLRGELRALSRRHDLPLGLALWCDAAAWQLYAEGWPRPMSRLLAREEELLRACGELDLLAMVLLNRARMLRVAEQTQSEAWRAMREAEELARELGLHALLTGARTDMCVSTLLEGDEVRALEFLHGVDLRPPDGERESSLECALRQAVTFPDESELVVSREFTLTFARSACRVAREVGDAGAVQWCLGREAALTAELDPVGALQQCRERREILRDLARERELSETLCLEAELLTRLGDPFMALELLREQVEALKGEALTWRFAGAARLHRDALRAAIRRCRDVEAAAALQAELEGVCRQLNDRAGARQAARDRVRLLRRRRSPEAKQSLNPEQLSFET